MADKSIWSRVGSAVGLVDSGPGEDVAKARAVPTNTIGTSGLSINEIGGTFDAQERVLNLVGQQRYEIYDRLVRDISIVAAGVRLFLNLIANAVWTVNPPEGLNEAETAQAQEYADQLYDDLYAMTSSWSSIIRKMAMYRMQGFAVLEWTAKRKDDGTIGFLDIEHRPQQTITRWQRDQGGTVEAVVQSVTGRGEVTIPRSKLVYAVDDTLTDSPEGIGLYRHLATTAERLKLFLELEEVGFTTDLRGIPIARAPLGELQTEVINAGPANGEARKAADSRRGQLLQPLRDFVDKHVRNKKLGMLLPSDTFIGKTADQTTSPSTVPKWGVELLNGDSTSFADMANAVNRMNQELARVLGCEHLLLGADGSGSLALARSKVGTFYLTVSSSLMDLVEVGDRDVVAPYATLNGWPEELWPQLGVNEISDRDVEQVADVLAKMAQAGAVLMPDDPAIGEVRDLVGLSRPPEDGMAMDASLNPGRKDPADPDNAIDDNPEDKVAKARVIRSRRAKKRRRRTD